MTNPPRPATAATAAASGGAAGALVVLIVWALSLRGVIVPGDVAAALMVLLSVGMHYVGLRIGAAAPETAPAAPVPAP